MFAGRIRAIPEDFVVNEQLAVEFAGEGEHDWLRIRKTGANTHWVAQQLARYAKVPERDAGYAGMKDRHAVTEQWFSAQLPGRPLPDINPEAADGFEILENTEPGKNGELQITDALLQQASNGCVIAYRFKGKRFDCGSVSGFVDATNYCYEHIYPDN